MRAVIYRRVFDRMVAEPVAEVVSTPGRPAVVRGDPEVVDWIQTYTLIEPGTFRTLTFADGDEYVRTLPLVFTGLAYYAQVEDDQDSHEQP